MIYAKAVWKTFFILDDNCALGTRAKVLAAGTFLNSIRTLL